jgi:hypothetical protein
LIFDQVVSAESLPMPKFGSSSQTARTGSVTGDLSQNINNSGYVSPDQFCLLYSFILNFVLSLLGKYSIRALWNYGYFYTHWGMK